MAPITRSRTAAARKIFPFPSLPTELRLMIWRESFKPRILHITTDTIHLPQPRSFRWGRHNIKPSPVHFRFKSREKPPTALHICRESRAVALKHYTLSFHSKTDPPERASEMKQTALYFNPELDTVHVVASAFPDALSDLAHCSDKETIESIKVLVIERRHILYQHHTTYRWTRCIAGCIHPFEGLETLILVIPATTSQMGWDGDESSIRVNMENDLVQAKDRLVLRGIHKEWKLPSVMVMNSRAFELYL